MMGLSIMIGGNAVDKEFFFSLMSMQVFAAILLIGGVLLRVPIFIAFSFIGCVITIIGLFVTYGMSGDKNE